MTFVQICSFTILYERMTLLIFSQQYDALGWEIACPLSFDDTYEDSVGYF